MATEVERLRRKLADKGDPPAFSDADLQTLLDEEGTFAGALRAGFGELLADAARLHRYAFGQQAYVADKQQVFDHVYILWQQAGGEAVGLGGAGDTARTIRTGDLTYAMFPTSE